MDILLMSVSGSALIAAILICRTLLQNRVLRSVWPILWLLAMVRLLIPFSVASPTSVFNLLTREELPPPAVGETVMVTAEAVQSAAVPEPVGAGTLSARLDLTAVWLCGAGLLAVIFVGQHLRCRRRYRMAVTVDSPIDLPRRVRLRMLDGVGAPLTYGLFRPVILINSRLLGDTPEARAVLLHELSHVRHGDVAYKALLLLCGVIHWFNPLVWLMVCLAPRDLEMRADADVVRALGTKKAYAMTLIAAEEQKLNSVMSTGFSTNSTEARIKALVHDKPKKVTSVWAGVLMAALLFGLFATDQMPVQAAEPESAVSAAPQLQSTSPDSVTDPVTQTDAARPQLHVPAKPNGQVPAVSITENPEPPSSVSAELPSAETAPAEPPTAPPSDASPQPPEPENDSTGPVSFSMQVDETVTFAVEYWSIDPGAYSLDANIVKVLGFNFDAKEGIMYVTVQAVNPGTAEISGYRYGSLPLAYITVTLPEGESPDGLLWQYVPG